MSQTSVSLRFKVPSASGGGVAKVTPYQLSVEYEPGLEALGAYGLARVLFPTVTQDPNEHAKLIKQCGSVKVYNVPIAEIESVHLSKGWFKSLVIISTKTMASVHAAPGSDRGRLFLQIERYDKGLAEQFVSFLEHQVSAYNANRT